MPANTSPIELQVTLLPLVIEGVIPSQKLTILANGQVIHSARHARWSVVRVQLPQIGTTELTLTFIHPDATAPSNTTGRADSRQLAFFLTQMSLKPMQSIEQSNGPVVETRTPETIPATSTISPDISVGRNGWLFLTGGSNNALRYYVDASYFTATHAADWADLLLARHARLARMGVQYFHLGAPDKITVYPDYSGLDLPNYDNHPLRLLSRSLAGRGEPDLMLNPLDEFAQHPNRDGLYLKTDTHWTYLAGLTVLEMLSSRIGHPRKLSLNGRTTHRYRHVFDLGCKITPPVAEETFSVESLPSVRRIFANELALRFEENVKKQKPVVHNSINVVYRNSSPSVVDKILVIFGDSFMDFQPSNPTMIFAENFREVHFVWSPRIDFGYVARARASIVMSEVAERFMVRVPSDDYNLESEVAKQLATYPI